MLLRFTGVLPYVGAEPVPLKFCDGTVVAFTVLKKPPNERKTGRRRGSDAIECVRSRDTNAGKYKLTGKGRKIDVTDCPYLILETVPCKILVHLLVESKRVDDRHQSRDTHRDACTEHDCYCNLALNR